MLLILFCCIQADAQQQRLYTMFMYNKLGLNPGYAGYHDHACVTGIYRNQWIGFDGAPETQMLSFQTPLDGQRIGVGANLSRTSIGVSSMTTFDGIYAYRLPLGNGTLSLAAQASVRNLDIDYADPALRAVQDLSIDPGVEVGRESKVIANFGTGVYFHTDDLYLGLSAPRLMRSDIDLDDNNLFISREERHFYLMGGYVINAGYTLDVVPQVLVKYVTGAPVNVDINTSLIWKKDYTVGVSYRSGGASADFGESIDLLASARVARGLLLGVSYDFSLSALRKHSSGSVEVVLRYCFGQPAREGEFVNPRYF